MFVKSDYPRRISAKNFTDNIDCEVIGTWSGEIFFYYQSVVFRIKEPQNTYWTKITTGDIIHLSTIEVINPLGENVEAFHNKKILG